MPWLAAALDPCQAEIRLRHALGESPSGARSLHLTDVEMLRYKPGRRCLIAYTVRLDGDEALTVLGKSRARGDSHAACALQRALWAGGFDAASPDGIAVAEPLGEIPEWGMWLQRRAAGIPATQILAGPQGRSMAPRISEAIHKVHTVGPAVSRVHTMGRELDILCDRLGRVALSIPPWRRRLERLSAACARLGASVGHRRPRPIHRDFYPDQVLVDGSSVTLLDFDEYSMGDPALDVGNFAGHLIEQALRLTGRPGALDAVLERVVSGYAALAGASAAGAVDAFTTLTLARHIFLSTQFADRLTLTEPLLELCERRLAA